MTSSTSLLRALVGLVVERDWFFESCDDEVLHPDDAVKQLEWGGYVLGNLSEADKQQFLEILAELTAEEEDPDYRRFLESYPETSGLVEIDD